MNAHDAGAPRSDPETGNPAGYGRGLGSQGYEIRIYNYVRYVRGSIRRKERTTIWQDGQ